MSPCAATGTHWCSAQPIPERGSRRKHARARKTQHQGADRGIPRCPLCTWGRSRRSDATLGNPDTRDGVVTFSDRSEEKGLASQWPAKPPREKTLAERGGGEGHGETTRYALDAAVTKTSQGLAAMSTSSNYGQIEGRKHTAELKCYRDGGAG